MADLYLVMFVVEEATDAAAEELGALIRAAQGLHGWTGAEPRFFDQVPHGGNERTVGVFVRVSDLAVADRGALSAFVHAAAAAAGRLGVALEVQLGEQPLGTMSGGEIDSTIALALFDRLDVEL